MGSIGGYVFTTIALEAGQSSQGTFEPITPEHNANKASIGRA